MSDTKHVALAAIHRFDLGVIICKSCHQVIRTVPTNGYRRLYGLCNSSACRDKNKEADQ
ncbi:GapA-binding peptide SR1P [Paenibacillus pectinilyticus]|uniref:GapA-binding peptide SR1P n=1 Tax=Paenibacillus pectinilyticus TaxID=512399 RepID=UPI001428A0F3|nr:GapA-binding peptide SR1P [Paenibacillus pectinilyticus]